jgi:hypothetical protein
LRHLLYQIEALGLKLQGLRLQGRSHALLPSARHQAIYLEQLLAE